MFQICIYFELLYAQIASPHCTFCLLHPMKMMVNVVLTLLPMVECFTFQHSLLFSTLLLFIYFSTIPLPLLISVCAHSFALPFPLLLFAIFQLRYLYYVSMNSRTSKTHTTSYNKRKQLSMVTLFIFVLKLLAHPIHFLACLLSFN